MHEALNQIPTVRKQFAKRSDGTDGGDDRGDDDNKGAAITHHPFPFILFKIPFFLLIRLLLHG